jgi:DNA-directed RNA polymerase sigma subunit (sigma70/sigma32)
LTGSPRPTVSLDTLVGEDASIALGDLLSDEADVDGRGDPVNVVMAAARGRDIDRLLDEILDPRAASVIRRRFGLGGFDEETLDSIGSTWNVTRERIRQIERRALTQLMESSRVRPLYEYLVTTKPRRRATPNRGCALLQRQHSKQEPGENSR